MLIEYKIKFEKGGVTVTQRVEPNASSNGPVSNGQVAPRDQSVRPTATAGLATGHHLGGSFAVGESKHPESNAPTENPKVHKDKGSGDGDKTDTGGGPGSEVAIVFGPIVIAAPGDTGGGDGDKTDPGGNPPDRLKSSRSTPQREY